MTWAYKQMTFHRMHATCSQLLHYCGPMLLDGSHGLLQVVKWPRSQENLVAPRLALDQPLAPFRPIPNFHPIPKTFTTPWLMVDTITSIDSWNIVLGSWILASMTRTMHSPADAGPAGMKQVLFRQRKLSDTKQGSRRTSRFALLPTLLA